MQPDPVTLRELPTIEKIVRDETWLEAERRGAYVPPDDPVVRETCAWWSCGSESSSGRNSRTTPPHRRPATTEALKARQAVLD